MKIRCKLCNTIIEGDKKGNLITCKCGKCAIDETPYYYRIIGNYEDFEELKSDDCYEKYRRVD
jgi:hypothetical protein